MVAASVASSVATRMHGLVTPAGSFVHLLAGMWGHNASHHGMSSSKGGAPDPVSHQLRGPLRAPDGQSTRGNSSSSNACWGNLWTCCKVCGVTRQHMTVGSPGST